MGGTSKQSSTTTSQATPYEAAKPGLDSILGALNKQAGTAGLNTAQSGALDQVASTFSGGNPYTGLLDTNARDMMAGGGAQANDANITANLNEYRGALMPWATGANSGENSALKGYLDTMASDISGRINGQFAAAGRDMSGYNQQTVARGVSEGVAPVLAAQYNQDADRSLNAANSMFGAGNSTYGLLNANNAQANANKVTGADTGKQALDAKLWGPTGLLNVEAQRFGIPTDQLTTLLGAISPVAQAFGTSTSNTQGTSQMSGADQFYRIASGLGALMPKGPISFGG